MRLVLARLLSVFGAAAMAEAAGKPSWVPPLNPSDTLLTYAPSLLPSSVAAHVLFCELKLVRIQESWRHMCVTAPRFYGARPAGAER